MADEQQAEELALQQRRQRYHDACARLDRLAFKNALDLQKLQYDRQQQEAEQQQARREREEREAAEEAHWIDYHREWESEQARKAVPPPHHTAEGGKRAWLASLAASRAALAAEEEPPTAPLPANDDLRKRLARFRASLTPEAQP